MGKLRPDTDTEWKRRAIGPVEGFRSSPSSAIDHSSAPCFEC